MTIRRTRVEIDANDHTEVFPAVVRDGEHWNGFACPFFNADTVLRIAAWISKTGDDYYTILWDSDGETVIFVQTDGSENLDYWDVQRIEPTDEGLYPIGSWGWTWQELDKDAPTDDVELDTWLAKRRDAGTLYSTAHNAALHAAYAEGCTSQQAVRIATAAGKAALGTMEALNG